MKHAFLSGLVLVFASACATTPPEYLPITEKNNYGYQEHLQDDGHYILSVILPPGPESNSLSFQYWNRRAEELCGSSKYEKNIYKAIQPTSYSHGAYVQGGVGAGGWRAGNFTLEGQLICPATTSDDYTVTE